MPALRVCIDHEHLVTIACDDLEFLDARVSATKVKAPLAELEVLGFAKDASHTARFWLSEFILEAGQHISVEFLESGQSTKAGKSFEELHPPEEQCDVSAREGMSRPEMIERLAAMPIQHQLLSCEVALGDRCACVETVPADLGYSFSVLWHSVKPQECSVRLSTHSIEELRTGQYGNCHFESKLSYHEIVSLEVRA